MIVGCFSLSPEGKDEQTYDRLRKSVDFRFSTPHNFDISNFSCTKLQHFSLPFDQNSNVFLSESFFALIEGYCRLNDSILSAKDIHKLYADKGLNFLNDISGEFVIILHDGDKRISYLIRDHIGTVPMAFGELGGNVYYSTDFMGLCQGLSQGKKIDSEYLLSRFYDYEVNYMYTPFKGVRKLLPGHYLEIRDNKLSETKYWFPENIKTLNGSPSLTEVAQTFQRFTDSALKIGMKSHSCGAHISGGLDSTFLAVRMSQIYPHTINAFSWSPDRKTAIHNIPYDERDLIEEQCTESDIKVNYTNISVDNYRSFIDNWRCPSESIFEDTVHRNASELNVNAIISGWGGDDFIGLRDDALYYESCRAFRIRRFYKTFRKSGVKAKAMHFVNNILFPTRRKLYLKYKIHPDYINYFREDLNNKLDQKSSDIFRSKRKYQLGMLAYYHIAQRCDDWYVNGQRNGIVYRYPFLDRHLVEYSISLPIEPFISSEYDRPVMREIARGVLTEKIRLLQKQGDPVSMKNALSIQKRTLKELMGNLNDLQQNAELKFINFKRLKADLDLFGDNHPNSLNYFLHQLFSTDSFVKNYQQEYNK